MKVAVLGAGAIGSMLGGLIQRHAPEVDVLLVARGKHGEAMRRQGGVNLEGSWGSVHVPVNVSSDPKDLAGSDWILLTVKSHHTQETIGGAADHVGQATVISIQNGINQRTLTRYIPAERLVMAMTDTIIAISAPGTVSMQAPARSSWDRVLPTLGWILSTPLPRLLRKSCPRVVIDPNVLGAQYNKLVFNALGAASSLSASDFLGECILHRPWRNAVAIPLQQECLDVLARSGVQLSRVRGGSDALRFQRLLHLLNRPVVGPLTELVVRKLSAANRSASPWASTWHHGKQTEVDAINGEILQLARGHGIHAPLNGKVVELVHQLEQCGGFFTRDEVIAMFRANEP